MIIAISWFAHISDHRNMKNQAIDGDWIAARLKERGKEHGDQERLADYLGINGDKVSKTIKGIRKVQVSEVIPLLIFFGYTIIPPDDEFGALYERWQAMAKEEKAVMLAAARGLPAPSREAAQ